MQEAKTTAATVTTAKNDAESFHEMRAMTANDPATRPAGRVDCNQSAPAGRCSAGLGGLIVNLSPKSTSSCERPSHHHQVLVTRLKPGANEIAWTPEKVGCARLGVWVSIQWPLIQLSRVCLFVNVALRCFKAGIMRAGSFGLNLPGSPLEYHSA